MMSLLAHPLLPRNSSTIVFSVYEGVVKQTPTAMDRPFVCKEPGCGRRFNRKFTLNEHNKTHTGEKPYVCPLVECSRRFSTSGNLARHKRLHASLKPFECDINGCKRSFPSQSKLDHHIKIHTGRRTHVCHVSSCTKTFSTAGNLTRHIKNSHPELLRNTNSFYHYAQTSLVRTLPITSREHLHVIPAAESLAKLEPIPPVFSPDSVELSSFHDELSVFQMACQPRDMDPVDIARCSISVLDEVIAFELTKNV